METKPKKIIIDTNLWISFLISKNYMQLDEILFSKGCILSFSEELLTEFLSVIKRPKFRKFFSVADTENLIETIQEYSEFFNVKSEVTLCRDKKDNFLLALAKDSDSDFLITGDKDLLALKSFGKTEIITMTEFMKMKF